jgi:hypothetical protein
LVSEKLVLTPLVLALTEYEPTVLFAVNTGDVAVPAAVVTAVFTPPEKVPLGPLVGAVKVTVVPLIKLPKLSLTITTSGLLNEVPIAALWPEPDTTAMVAGAPALFVKEKAALKLPVLADTV